MLNSQLRLNTQQVLKKGSLRTSPPGRHTPPSRCHLLTAPYVLSQCHLSWGQVGDGLERKQVSTEPRMSPVWTPVFKILRL